MRFSPVRGTTSAMVPRAASPVADMRNSRKESETRVGEVAEGGFWPLLKRWARNQADNTERNTELDADFADYADNAEKKYYDEEREGKYKNTEGQRDRKKKLLATDFTDEYRLQTKKYRD